MPLRRSTLHQFVPGVTLMADSRPALRVAARAAHLHLTDSRAHLHLCLRRNKQRVAGHSTAVRLFSCRSRPAERSLPRLAPRGRWQHWAGRARSTCANAAGSRPRRAGGAGGAGGSARRGVASFITIIWQIIDESRNYRDCYPVALR